ncbi:hypothetical protein B0T14DRAFT_567591 [Immersiella caudata]|uniref:Uncharacterized protein n=1 Tax=Immersiella caudata TaxID=314043 RepID=A0AA39WSX5_9PEZI|nr:hypothetical protein B0T14DRAFT_567591 [Immersiella caudata]
MEGTSQGLGDAQQEMELKTKELVESHKDVATKAMNESMALQSTINDLKLKLIAATKEAKENTELTTAKVRGELIKHLDVKNKLVPEVKALKESNDTLQGQLDRERSEADKSARKMAGCRTKVTLWEQFGRLQGQFDQATSDADKRQNELSSQIESTQEKFKSKAAEIDSLRQKLEAKATDLNKEKKEKKALQATNKSLRAEDLLGKDKENKVLQEGNQQLKDAVQVHLSQVKALEEAKKSLQDQVSKYITGQVQKARLSSSEIDKAGEAKKKLEEDLEASRAEVFQQKENLEALRQRNEAVEKEKAELSRTVEALRQGNKGLQESIEAHFGQATLLEHLKAELIRNHDHALRKPRHEFQEKIDGYESKATKREEDNASLQSEVKTLEQTSQDLRQQIDRLREDARSLQQANQDLQGQDNAILTSDIQLLQQANQTLQEQFERSVGEVASQEKNMQELQGKHDALLSLERELRAALKAKDDEIESLKLQPAYAEGASASLPGADSPHLLGSGLPTPTLAPFLKPEEPESGPPTSVALGGAPQKAAAEDQEPELERCLQLYNRFTFGLTRLYYEQLGLGIAMDPYHDTPQLGNDVLVSYLATLGELEKPVCVENSPVTNCWKVQEPWAVAPAVEVTPQPYLFEQFIQLCLLISSMRDHDDSRPMLSVANIVASLIHTDHINLPPPAAAFLQATATLPPPAFQGKFSSRNVALAILVCQLCRRLEEAFPDAPEQTWTVARVLGPEVQNEADKHWKTGGGHQQLRGRC